MHVRAPPQQFYKAFKTLSLNNFASNNVAAGHQ